MKIAKIWTAAFLSVILFLIINFLAYFLISYCVHNYLSIDPDFDGYFVSLGSWVVFALVSLIIFYFVGRRIVNNKYWFYKYFLYCSFLIGAIGLVAFIFEEVLKSSYHPVALEILPPFSMFCLIAWIPYIIGYYKENRKDRNCFQKFGLYFIVSLPILFFLIFLYYIFTSIS